MNTDSYLIGLQRPIVISDRFRQVQDFAFNGKGKPSVYTNDFFGADGDEPYWANAVGKRVLCKAQWLTGQERNICGAQILSKCGRKPVCAGIVSKKCKQRKADWLKCAQNVSYTPNPADTAGGGSGGAGTGTESIPDTGAGDSGSTSPEKDSPETIMGIDKNIVIYGGLSILLIGGAIAAVSMARKNKSSMVQSPLARR